MKKIVVVVLGLLLSIGAEAFAFPPPSPLPPAKSSRSNVSIGLNYSNTVKTTHHANAVSRVIINERPPVHIMPPPPPPRYYVRYRDYTGERRFHARSYYVPSYCMPDKGFYYNTSNPFCNHYRPYGSNFYISF